LISAQIGIDIEDLTVVILSHELAHAYTHMGLDIDDRKWETESFRDSENPFERGPGPALHNVGCQAHSRAST
jgi:hypothetical protein